MFILNLFECICDLIYLQNKIDINSLLKLVQLKAINNKAIDLINPDAGQTESNAIWDIIIGNDLSELFEIILTSNDAQFKNLKDEFVNNISSSELIKNYINKVIQGLDCNSNPASKCIEKIIQISNNNDVLSTSLQKVSYDYNFYRNKELEIQFNGAYLNYLWLKSNTNPLKVVDSDDYRRYISAKHISAIENIALNNNLDSLNEDEFIINFEVALNIKKFDQVYEILKFYKQKFEKELSVIEKVRRSTEVITTYPVTKLFNMLLKNCQFDLVHKILNDYQKHQEIYPKLIEEKETISKKISKSIHIDPEICKEMLDKIEFKPSMFAENIEINKSELKNLFNNKIKDNVTAENNNKLINIKSDNKNNYIKEDIFKEVSSSKFDINAFCNVMGDQVNKFSKSPKNQERNRSEWVDLLENKIKDHVTAEKNKKLLDNKSNNKSK